MFGSRTINKQPIENYSENSPMWDRVLNSDYIIYNRCYPDDLNFKCDSKNDKIKVFTLPSHITDYSDIIYNQHNFENMIYHLKSRTFYKRHFHDELLKLFPSKEEFDNFSKKYNIHWNSKKTLFVNLESRANFIKACDGTIVNDLYTAKEIGSTKELVYGKENIYKNIYTYYLNGIELNWDEFNDLTILFNQVTFNIQDHFEPIRDTIVKYMWEIAGHYNWKIWKDEKLYNFAEIYKYVLALVFLKNDTENYEKKYYYYLTQINLWANNKCELTSHINELPTIPVPNIRRSLEAFFNQSHSLDELDDWFNNFLIPKLEEILANAKKITEPTPEKHYKKLWNEISDYTYLFETKEPYTLEVAEREFASMDNSKQLGKLKKPKDLAKII